jgi:hypothetical protein
MIICVNFNLLFFLGIGTLHLDLKMSGAIGV